MLEKINKVLNNYSLPDVPFNHFDNNGPIEGIFLGINLKKSKWLFFGTYHRPKQSDDYYFTKVTHAIDFCANSLLVGDLNVEEHESPFN